MSRVPKTSRAIGYGWIVFDADGTLFDYARAESNALRRTLDEYGVACDATALAEFAGINDRLWAELERGRVSPERLRVLRFEELARRLGADLPASRVSTAYLGHLGEETALLTGAREVVETLSRHHRLALATNGLAEVQHRRFRASGLTSFFTCVVISEEVGAAKPDPRFFAEAFAAMGNPDRTAVLMVGDSLSSDIAGAAGFGLDTCWFNPSGRPNDSPVAPTFEIARLEEILSLVGHE